MTSDKERIEELERKVELLNKSFQNLGKQVSEMLTQILFELNREEVKINV